jgi:hypothetical protein
MISSRKTPATLPFTGTSEFSHPKSIFIRLSA